MYACLAWLRRVWSSWACRWPASAHFVRGLPPPGPRSYPNWIRPGPNQRHFETVLDFIHFDSLRNSSLPRLVAEPVGLTTDQPLSECSPCMMRCPSAVRTTTPTSPGRPSSSDDVDGWAQHRLGGRVGGGATDVIRGIAEPISHLADARGPHGADRGALELKGSLGGAPGVRLVVSG